MDLDWTDYICIAVISLLVVYGLWWRKRYY